MKSMNSDEYIRVYDDCWIVYPLFAIVVVIFIVYYQQ